MVLEVLAITISVISIIVSAAVAVFSWKRSRSIYGLERMKFAIDPGDSRSDKEKQTDEELLKKLKSGKYTIITTYALPNSGYNVFVLGKLKKDKS